MAYQSKINPTIFVAPGVTNNKSKMKLYNAGRAKARIHVGSATVLGGQPVTDKAGLVPYNVNNFIMIIDIIGVALEDEAFRRLGISSWRFQLAELLRKDLIKIDSTPGAAATYLTVDEVMQLWARNP